MNIEERNVAIVGLGYVGLPLAIAFGKIRPVIAFDIHQQRIEQLQAGYDKTKELSREALCEAKFIHYTNNQAELRFADIYIITVPTPIDLHKKPDFKPLIKASRMIGSMLKPNDIVIYESTVYPGAIEEICVPILAEQTPLNFNTDFFVGYSPERINPGDPQHRIHNVMKITAGSTPETASIVDKLYQQIIEVGTYPVSSIKIAEAAKVIENTQRDLNIALINELSIIFNKLNIDTEEVLKAAETKWNFLSFRPGLVGGHCIGVDPYYLTYKAESLGYHPEIILAGRRLNDQMGQYVASELIKAMLKKRIHVDGARILIMGLTFKENCPDIRNTRVIDIISELQQYQAIVDIYDPIADAAFAEQEYGLSLLPYPLQQHYDAIILAVAHSAFQDMGEHTIRQFGKTSHVLYDLKYLLPQNACDLRL